MAARPSNSQHKDAFRAAPAAVFCFIQAALKSTPPLLHKQPYPRHAHCAGRNAFWRVIPRDAAQRKHRYANLAHPAKLIQTNRLALPRAFKNGAERDKVGLCTAHVLFCVT